MKQLYLDSANLADVTLMCETDLIQGVTTNPSLMAKEEPEHYAAKLKKIRNVLSQQRRRMHLSVEVTTLDPQRMLTQAFNLKDDLEDEHVDLFVKIPVMFDTLRIITHLAERGVKVNATACMTPLQAKMAEDAGAQIVSFFWNRIRDAQDHQSPGDVVGIFSQLRRNSKIICGSIRKPEDVVESWLSGADIVTASVKVLKESISHPKTTEAIEQFQKDIESWHK